MTDKDRQTPDINLEAATRELGELPGKTKAAEKPASRMARTTPDGAPRNKSRISAASEELGRTLQRLELPDFPIEEMGAGVVQPPEQRPENDTLQRESVPVVKEETQPAAAPETLEPLELIGQTEVLPEAEPAEKASPKPIRKPATRPQHSEAEPGAATEKVRPAAGGAMDRMSGLLGRAASSAGNMAKKHENSVVKPFLALLLICAFSVMILGIANAALSPIINNGQTQQGVQLRRTLLPAADSFEDITPPADELPTGATALYRARNGAGYVAEAESEGYAGVIPVMVGIDAEGRITGVRFLPNNETEGLGARVSEPAFTQQFEGIAASPVQPNQLSEPIAGATISTGGAVSAVNAAIALYNQVVLGISSGALSPEEVRQNLLPNAESFTQISVDIPGITEAWRGSDGNYIIYAAYAQDRDVPVVAAVAMTPDGVILNLWVDTAGEGANYGQTLATNGAFLKSFIGQTSAAEVPAVAGVTGSSNAVKAAVQMALDALPAVKEVG